MPSNSQYSAAYKQEEEPKRGKWSDFKRCGQPLPTNMVQEIFRLRMQGLSLRRIAKEMDLNIATVTRYVKKGRKSYGAPQPPIDEQIAEVHQAVRRAETFDVTRSFLKTLANLDTMDDHFADLIKQGRMPDQATPLHLKQLAEAKRLIVTLPQDLNKQRQDLYDQLGARDLGEAEVEDESTSLADSGRMTLLPGETGDGKPEKAGE